MIATTSIWLCSRCHRKLRKADEFCRYCGASAQDAQSQTITIRRALEQELQDALCIQEYSCPACGHWERVKGKETAYFCPRCGQTPFRAEGDRKELQVYCQSCEKVAEPSDKYCRYCGAAIGQPKFRPGVRNIAQIYGPPPMRKEHNCEACGHRWRSFGGSDEQKYCPVCGGNVSAGAQHPVNIGTLNSYKYCSNCHKKVLSADKYCRYCGVSVFVSDYKPSVRNVAEIYGPPPVSRDYRCPSCGYRWQNRQMIRDNHCPHCGGGVKVTETEDDLFFGRIPKSEDKDPQ